MTCLLSCENGILILFPCDVVLSQLKLTNSYLFYLFGRLI